MKRVPCFMCKKRKAKPLTASRDRNVYVNAENVTLFCSMRCAANYALLWGSVDIMQGHHLCEETGEWEPGPKSECEDCGDAD